MTKTLFGFNNNFVDLEEEDLDLLIFILPTH
jgi:hypothetical protein